MYCRVVTVSMLNWKSIKIHLYIKNLIKSQNQQFAQYLFFSPSPPTCGVQKKKKTLKRRHIFESVNDSYQSIKLKIHLSIHLSPLIRCRVTEVAVPAGDPRHPFPGYISLTRDSEAFPGQGGDIILPPSPQSALCPPPRWTCLEHLPR